MLFDSHTILICPADKKDKCNQIFRVLTNENGQPYDTSPAPGATISVPLSSTGAGPATHYLGATWELEEFGKKITQLRDGTQPIFSATDWAQYPPIQNIGDARQSGAAIYIRVQQAIGRTDYRIIARENTAAALAALGLQLVVTTL